MANPHLIAALNAGVQNWNQFRTANPHSPIDLSEADLQGRDLTEANLSNANLRVAKLNRTVLTNCNLRHADLTGADLRSANLEKADLIEAVLEWADATEANLRDAKFENANLFECNVRRAQLFDLTGVTAEQLQAANNWLLAFYDSQIVGLLGLSSDHNLRISNNDFNGFDFRSSKLRDAELTGANLSSASLRGCYLRGAKLGRANLKNANLEEADLQSAVLEDVQQATMEQLQAARNWPLAYYSQELCKMLGLPANHAERLKKRDFTGAQFEQVDLSNADLEGADLRNVTIKGAVIRETNISAANLQGADLRTIKQATATQIKTATNWALAQYSPDLLAQLGLQADHNQKLQQRDLRNADLRGALLDMADLSNFKLRKANLTGASLRNCNLSNTSLVDAQLQNAVLDRSNLEGADLSQADLTGSSLLQLSGVTKNQIQQARNWLLAIYSLDIKSLLGIQSATDSQLRNKVFDGLDLSSAKLSLENLENASFLNSILVGANLNGTNLKKAVFIGASLAGADFRDALIAEANFDQADLTGADMRDANMVGATFKGANLTRVGLRDTNLQDACLCDAKGLLSGQLGGANVSGADLPSDIKEFKGLASIDESSKNASGLFVILLAACLYVALTIAATTDPALLTNSATSSLPVIQTAIPIVGFYLVAPPLLFVLYVYFHLSLQRLWEQLADQPAIFPDGKPLDKRAYPWLLNGFVQSCFKQLAIDRPALSRLQSGLSYSFAWWLIPATLLLFWIRYLPRQDWAGTTLHVALVTLAITNAVTLRQLATHTLKGDSPRPLILSGLLRDKRRGTHLLLPLAVAISLFFLSFKIIALAPDINRSVHRNQPHSDRRINLNWAQSLFSLVRYPFADLSEADVSTKPATWSGKSSEDLALVKGASLKGSSLRYAEGFRAFLVNADLRGADLKGADFDGADLRKANLESAYLGDSCLIDVDLREANLRNAILSGANLSRTNLMGANLEGAVLGDANLRVGRNWLFAIYDQRTLKELKLSLDHNERLRSKNLSSYDLAGADVSELDLREFNLSKTNLGFAHLEDSDLRNADLRRSTLRGANLARARLESAKLSGADLGDTDLSGTHLEGVDLTDAIGLGCNQIRVAFIDEKTLLPRSTGKPTERMVCPQF